MTLLTNDFDAIRVHYGRWRKAILAAPKNEWGIDPYAWDAAGFVLTPIEAALWHDIRSADAVFYPQYPVGRFFVDFGNPVARVAIECDGRAYHQDADRDKRRQREIEAMGWTVYRLTGSECRTDFDEAAMENGAARKLIDRIVAAHGVGRK